MLLEEFNEYERCLEDISYKSENNYFVKRSDDVTLYYFKNGNRTVLEIPKLHIYCEKVSVVDSDRNIEYEVINNLL